VDDALDRQQKKEYEGAAAEEKKTQRMIEGDLR